MKKVVSNAEFREYCNQNEFKEFVFATENQSWYKVSDPCKISMSFSNMSVVNDPSMIYLKSDAGDMVIDRVRSIEIDTEATLLGTVFIVGCGRINSTKIDITYTIIAR